MKNELKTYIRLKYFPIDYTVEYINNIPEEVLEDFHNTYLLMNNSSARNSGISTLIEHCNRNSISKSILEETLYELLVKFYSRSGYEYNECSV